MDANQSLITRLMAKYARKEALSDEEWGILEEWWNASPENQALARQFGDEDWVNDALAKLNRVPKKEMWQEINKQLDEIEQAQAITPPSIPNQPIKRTKTFILRLSMAAAAVLVTVIAIRLIVKRGAVNNDKSTPIQASAAVPAAPGKRDAIWIDSGGRSVQLGVLPIGAIVSKAGNSILRKVDTNALAYDVAAKNTAGEEKLYRTCLATGSDCSAYHLQLSDGSAVWLASGASFHYSNKCRDTAHSYTIVGKAFFDIAKAGGKPFVIDLPNGNRINVMGTTFSVEANADSSGNKVALLTGSLNLITPTKTIQLQPGEEAVTHPDQVDIRKIGDPVKTTAWVGNSLSFHFQEADLGTVIAQVARWYGLKVSNPQNLKGTTFTGDLPRPSSPDLVIDAISTAQTRFAKINLQDNAIVISDYSGTK